MQIEKIIYDTTRELVNLEDKLRIATVFIFCRKVGSELFAKLLYNKNHAAFVDELNETYKQYDVDFTINFSNSNVKNSFYKTLEQVKKETDPNGFYKALVEGDEFALVISQIINNKMLNHEI